MAADSRNANSFFILLPPFCVWWGLFCQDAQRTARIFEMFLGSDLQGRKDHIAETGYQYLELADIS